LGKKNRQARRQLRAGTPRSPGEQTNALVVAFCAYYTVEQYFALSLAEFCRWRSDLVEAVITVQHVYLPSGRNYLVRKFLEETTAPWLLFVDSDILFSPQDVDVLLSTADPMTRPVVAGSYANMNEAGSRTEVWWREEAQGGSDPFERLSPVPLKACGMGFTLIHRRVLEAMRDSHEGSDPWIWFDTPYRPGVGERIDRYSGGRIGEDYEFCIRARELGFSIWGVPWIEVGHMKRSTVFPQEDDRPQVGGFTI
jgi:hypothetical protein